MSPLFADLSPTTHVKIVFRDCSLYPKQLPLFCLLWLISANFAKTLVRKLWIWRHIMTPQTTHTKYRVTQKHHTYATEWNPPMKIVCVCHWLGILKVSTRDSSKNGSRPPWGATLGWRPVAILRRGLGGP